MLPFTVLLGKEMYIHSWYEINYVSNVKINNQELEQDSSYETFILLCMLKYLFREGHADIIKQLLDWEADPHKLDDQGCVEDDFIFWIWMVDPWPSNLRLL